MKQPTQLSTAASYRSRWPLHSTLQHIKPMSTRNSKGAFRITFVLSAWLIAGSIMATIRTVSNDPNRPAMYGTFADAYGAAFDNDTIFIYGSTSGSVGGGTINKVLHIVGNGYDPFLPTYRSQMGRLVYATGSAGSTLEGVIVNAGVNVSNATGLIIRNCILLGQGFFPCVALDNNSSVTAINNIIMRNEPGCCYVDVAAILGGSAQPNGPHYFYNNVIISNYTGDPAGNRLLTNNFGNGLTSAAFENNVFLSWTAPCRLSESYSLNNAFANNIFFNVTTVSSNCDMCAFTNNLVAGCTDDCNLISGNQTGSGNVFDTPVFNNYTNGAWDFLVNDLSLAPGSPGELMGVGVFEGAYPMSPNTLHGQILTILPYISTFNLANPVIPETTGGPLSISSGAVIVQE